VSGFLKKCQHLCQLEEQGEHQCGQRRSFDERRRQDHRAADIGRRFRLPRDRLDRLAANAADAAAARRSE